MRILVDECVDHRIKPGLAGHDVWTVGEMGWNGKKNGDLLKAMVQDGFEVLLTVDKGFKYQQNIKTAAVAVVLLRRNKNQLAELMPLLPATLAALGNIQPGDVVEISPPP